MTFPTQPQPDEQDRNDILDNQSFMIDPLSYYKEEVSRYMNKPQSVDDELDRILHQTIGLGYAGKKPHNQNSLKKVIGIEEAKQQLRAWGLRERARELRIYRASMQAIVDCGYESVHLTKLLEGYDKKIAQLEAEGDSHASR